MCKEATPRSRKDDDDWLQPYEQAGSAAGGAKVIAFPPSLRSEQAACANERRALGVLLAAAALGLVIAIAAILVGYTRGPEPAATPAISPLDMTMERGANLPVEQWHSAF